MAIPPTSVVIPAAGEGARLPGRVRKPYRDLGGRPLLMRTLEAFQGLSFIKEIVLVVHRGDLARLERDWSKALAALKVARLVVGGPTRAESVARGVCETAPSSRLVLVHDAARPLVSAAEIRAVAEAASRRGAAILAVPVADTVKRVSPQGVILKTLPREWLWLAQTPQGFRRSLLLRRCRALLKGKLSGRFTDEAALLEGHVRVRVVPGSGDNVKVSTPRDLSRARLFRNL